uniref:ribosomal protein S3 n=1 Tax=Floccularia luteovirens TaxID=493452 RepID=UPI003002B3DE|nr:ribosomal protein S3 [Floccularia luteovirens]
MLNSNKFVEFNGSSTNIANINSLLSNPVSVEYNSIESNTSTANNDTNLDIKNSNKIEELKPNLYKYLKAISIYNMSKKGIVILNNRTIGYNFNSSDGVNNQKYNECYKYLYSVFKSMYCFISKPVFIITPDKVQIHLFYYLSIPSNNLFKWLKKTHKLVKNNKIVSNIKTNKMANSLNISTPTQLIIKKNNINRRLLFNTRSFRKTLRIFRSKKYFLLFKLISLNNKVLTNNFPNKFNILLFILSKFFKKPVELELIRLHHPYYDSNILVNLLGLIVKKKNINITIRKLYAKKNAVINFNDKNQINEIPAFLSGLNIKVAGRLLKEAIIPRKTTKIFEKGSTATGKVNMLDVQRITKKNKKGAFSITISSGQNFF